METTVILSVLLAVMLGMGAAEAAEQLDAQRVQTLAQMLPDQPEGLGRPVSDRTAWATQIKPEIADRYLTEPLPEQPDDLYLDFSRTGNRTRWQNVAFHRRGRLTPLVWAECVENQGRYLPALETLIQALCAEKTWVMPAHDAKLTNFKGESVDIDLASSALAWTLATADWLLGDKLSPATRRLLRERVEYFVLQPYRDMFSGRRAPNWWTKTTSNWNAVCLAGVTGAALVFIEGKTERAEYVAAAEMYSLNFLQGFTPDGYCSEGLGYWNYGFGHYVLLSETVRQATRGKLDLLALPGAKAPALFGARIMVDDTASPAFADCSVNARPAANTMFYLNRTLQLGLPQWDELEERHWGGSLFERALYGFPNAATSQPAATGPAPERELRSWFADAGILVVRPGGSGEDRLAAAMKGGHNAEHHNHNDVGSYTVFLQGRAPLLDPGAEVYTARTFSSKRYDSKLLNSFGHPVPVVVGQLQQTGAQAKATVIATEFTPAQDTLRLDLKAAYAVPELKTLERTFVYDRSGRGSLTVTDRVEYASPQTFETALIARQDWRQLAPDKFMVWDVDQALEVAVRVEGGEWELVTEEIREDASVQPVRLGVRLKQPVTTATVTMMITPLALTTAAGNLLLNGDFELGTFGWEFPRNSQGSLTTDPAAGGQTLLKITDPDSQSGSNVTSARFPAQAETAYVLSGKLWLVSGQVVGIGLYMQFHDETGKLLNSSDGKGNIDPTGVPRGQVGQWVDFSYPFTTPAGTTRMRLWIHSFNAVTVEAYLDDLQVKPAGG
jgi:hypothetical protein